MKNIFKNYDLAPLNSSVSTIKGSIIFLVGFFGIDVLSMLVSYFAKTILGPGLIDQETNLAVSTYGNFAVYLVLGISILLILNINDIKKLFKGFANSRDITRGLMFGFMLVAVSAVVSIIMNLINPSMGNSQNEEDVRKIISYQPLISFITIGIIGPMVEEQTYRLGLYGTIRKKSRTLAYLVTILVFSLIHMNFLAVTSSGKVILASTESLLNELSNLPIYMSSGLVLCFAYEYSDSIATSTIAHVFNNVLSFIASVI